MARRRTLIWLAGTAAAVTLTGGISAASALGPVTNASGPLTDISAAANPTDGANGHLVAVAPGTGNTRVLLVLTGLDPAAVGTTFGAHVHEGPCIAGDAAAAGPHYNTGTGGAPSRQNEVWLDFTVRPGGVAVSRTVVPFEIAAGRAQSVVIHALATQAGTGVAGARMACMPVAF